MAGQMGAEGHQGHGIDADLSLAASMRETVGCPSITSMTPKAKAACSDNAKQAAQPAPRLRTGRCQVISVTVRSTT